ncbi:MAG: UDP-3-O-(3-hydroxymyristoyl)glucosamine N-acyltransferase [bacterium]
MEKTLKELAEFVGGTVDGDPQILIRGVAGIKEAIEGEITFVANPKYLPLLPSTRASAVILSDKVKGAPVPSIRTFAPYVAFAKILHLFCDKPYQPLGIHPQAWVDPSAVIGKNVSIHPLSVIDKEVRIGDNVQIYSGAYIGSFSRIGDRCVIYPNVTIYHHTLIGSAVTIHANTVIGSDGFGYVWDGHEHYKIPQVGRVVIEDNVEIGAGTAIDRGTMGDTVIGAGTRIDNLVQIAHNVVIGESSIIVSQTGISGSAELGKKVTLGGQVGVAGHLKIGDNTIVAAKGGVSKDIPCNSIIAGMIGRPIQEWKKSEIGIRRLPELFEEIKRLKKKVQELEARGGGQIHDYGEKIQADEQKTDEGPLSDSRS